MVCCLNPNCQRPQNPDGINFCSSCGTALVPLLAGHYQVIRPLGGGGFARTYLAEDKQKLNERCVVKQLTPNVQGSWALQKATDLFKQEAERLQQLGHHPQIPRLYAYFEEDRYLYLVQQFIEGQNLSEELAQLGIWSEQKVWKLLLDLLKVLQFVHEQQVIHRDIKPENIIRHHSSSHHLQTRNTFSTSVSQAEESPALLQSAEHKLVLIDFGIAKQLGATVTVVEKPGTTIGSFGYAPIEQLKGGEAYPASDLYSLGVTCFELLTQVHPWELWTEQGYGWVSDWQRHLKSPISSELAWILDKLLQKDFEHRYQSASEVLKDLESGESEQHQSQKVALLSSSQSPLQGGNNRINLYSQRTGGGGKSQQTRLSVLLSKFLHLSAQNPWLMVVIIILLLGLGGYGSWHIQGQISATISTGEKLRRAHTLVGHSDMVRSIAISPDGQTLVSGSNDQTIKIWQLSSGTLKSTLTGHSSWISSVAISPDGEILASGSGDNTIKIWQLSTGRMVRTLTGHSSGVNSIAISPDGQTLVSGSADNTIKIWQLSTGQLVRTLTKHSYGVNCLAISPDGQTLVSGNGRVQPLGDSYTIKIWGLNSSFPKRTLTGHASWVNSLAITPDGQTLVSVSEDDTIKIWQLKTGDLVRTLRGHSSSVYAVALSPDGQTLVSGSEDNTIKVWQLSTGTLKSTFTGDSSAVYAVAISSDGQTLVSSGDDQTIKIWQMR